MPRIRPALFSAILALTVFAAAPRAGEQGNPFKASGPASENAASHQTLYASTGPTLTQYDVDTKAATLTVVGSITLPRNVQYAWPDPTHSVLYVAWSAATADRPFGQSNRHHVRGHLRRTLAGLYPPEPRT